MRIVLADESAAYRMVLRKFLQSLPQVTLVAEASDGREALWLVAAVAPDLLLMDLEMPVLDGWAVLRHLQARDTAAAAVVVFSAYPGTELARQVRAQGAVAHVPKGEIAHLLQAVVALSQENHTIGPI